MELDTIPTAITCDEVTNPEVASIRRWLNNGSQWALEKPIIILESNVLAITNLPS